MAAPVTSKQAAAAVTGWLSLDRAPLGETLGTSVQRVETFNDQAGNPLYYVAYLEPSGFVIIAADDLVEPIVGFAVAGQYDPSANNPLGALVSNDLAARIAYARQAGSVPPDTNAVQAQAKWQQLSPADGGPVILPKVLTSVSDVRIAPLTQTTWDQQTAAGAGTTACYNYYTPPYGDGNPANYPAGCVATAMAQFMRYYEFPSTGVGTASFTIYVDGSPTPYILARRRWRGRSLRMEQHARWSRPPTRPTVQCQAIGALVADAGATVNMEYASGGSSSSLIRCQDRFGQYLPFRKHTYGWNNNSQLGAGLDSP